MHAIKPSRRHIVGVASLTCTIAFVTLSFASLPAGAQTVALAPAPTVCPVLSVGNPNPGDDLIAGGFFISGTAYDPAATTGSGITRVDFFLGERESGGTFLGSAVTGTAAGGNPRGFNVEVTVPDNMNRGVDFAAYAISSVTGQETQITFPVLVGSPQKTTGATPTPIPTVETTTSTCPAGVAPATAPASAPAAAAPPVAAATPAPGAPAASVPVAGAPAANACPVLSVGNPNPADDLTPGGYVISGTAYDPAAMSGAGITRVDFFLGDRDSGGTFLGSAVPGSGANPRAFSGQVTVPDENVGVNFVAYAISSVTGQETVVSFPVLVGQPAARNPIATPTPIPLVVTTTNTCGSHA